MNCKRAMDVACAIYGVGHVIGGAGLLALLVMQLVFDVSDGLLYIAALVAVGVCVACILVGSAIQFLFFRCPACKRHARGKWPRTCPRCGARLY